jgi:hypothetical protein
MQRQRGEIRVRRELELLVVLLIFLGAGCHQTGSAVPVDPSGGAYCTPHGWADPGPSGSGGDGGPVTCVDPPCARPVCGDDGKVYASDCAAFAAGHGRYPWEVTCPTPTGYFPCGERFCVSGREYCVRMRGYLGSGRCAFLPNSCLMGPPACGCMSLQQTCGTCGCTDCALDAAGNLILFCTVA